MEAKFARREDFRFGRVALVGVFWDDEVVYVEDANEDTDIRCFAFWASVSGEGRRPVGLDPSCGEGVEFRNGVSIKSFVGEVAGLVDVMLTITGFANVMDTTRAVSSWDLRLETLDVDSSSGPSKASRSRSRRESS